MNLVDFVVAQLSDLHLIDPSTRLRPRALQRLLQLVGFMPGVPEIASQAGEAVGLLADSFDAIILSGDLAHTGDTLHLAAAKEYWIRYFDSKTFRALAMPGNHDRYMGLVGYPGSKNFESTFGASIVLGSGSELSRRDDGWRTGVDAVDAMIIERSGEALGIVAADFCLKSRIDDIRYLGVGEVYREVLDELVKVTDELTSEVGAVVWFSHFPPGGRGEGVGWRLELREWRRLTRAAARLGVQYIFCGHVHSRLSFQLNHDELPVNVSTASSVSVPPEASNSFEAIWLTVDNGDLKAVRQAPFVRTAQADGFELKSV